MATPKTIQSTVAFTDAQNNVIANGQLVLDLSQNCEVTSGGGQVVPKRVAIALTSSGLVPYSNITIASTSVASNVLTVNTSSSNGLAAGQSVYLAGLTTSTFLNGNSVTIVTATSSSFTAAFTHSNYSTTSDTGTVSSTLLWTNDQLTPSGTTYHARLYDANGNEMADFGTWSITGSAPIDLAQMTPTTTGTSYPAPVLLIPTAQQKITAYPLELATSLVLDGSTSGSTTLQASATASGTATLPANTGTIAETNLAQTWSAPQTFNSGELVLAGSTSGSVTLQPAATAGSNTATLPANTGTIAELNLAQTWTANQTFSGAGILSLPAPQVTVYTSGSGTYTTPTNARYLVVELVGGGAGAAGNGAGASGGGNGGSTTFGSSFLTANGGVSESSGGTASGGDINITGASGTAYFSGVTVGSDGGYSVLGGAGRAAPNSAASNGGNAVANSGSGGGSGSQTSSSFIGGGGGAGGYCRKLITSPSATYSYAVGAGGSGGAGASGGNSGGAGAAGIIIVAAYFQ